MKLALLTLSLVIFTVAAGVAQMNEKTGSLVKTLDEGNELSIPVTKDGRINISLQNLLDEKSVVYWTQYVGENERPENEIGPRKYRTVTLSPKIDDENEPIRRDRKEIVLNTGNADSVVIKVEKGKVEISVHKEKKM
jgi:hypothetical protein